MSWPARTADSLRKPFIRPRFIPRWCGRSSRRCDKGPIWQQSSFGIERAPAQRRTSLWSSLRQPLSPDRARRLHSQLQLRALVRFAKRIAASAAGEAALGTDGEPLKGDILRRFIDAPLQAVDRFEYRRFAADQPEHYALSLRHEPQRRKIACSRRVIFEQKMVCVRARKKPLRHPFVSAIREMATPEVAAAHVDADDDTAGTASDRGINRIDVALDQHIGIAARDRNPVADHRIAQQRASDLVNLQVAAARRNQLCDLLPKHADEIGEEPIDIAIGGAI